MTVYKFENLNVCYSQLYILYNTLFTEMRSPRGSQNHSVAALRKERNALSKLHFMKKHKGASSLNDILPFRVRLATD